MFFIESERLKLIPLNYVQLLLMENNRPELERSLNLNPSAMVINASYQTEINDAMQGFWLPNTQTYPDLYHWYTNWQVVLNSSNIIIGGIGYGGYPNDYGETSVGYMIDQQHWGKGYATEAVLALAKWGFNYSILKAIIADTNLNNKASQRVLLKAGFKALNTDQEKAYFRLNKV